jgi:hypothetical protein
MADNTDKNPPKDKRQPPGTPTDKDKNGSKTKVALKLFEFVGGRELPKIPKVKPSATATSASENRPPVL